MKNFILTLAVATLCNAGIPAMATLPTESNDETPWSYTFSQPDGGKKRTTTQNGITTTQRYTKTQVFNLDTTTDGIRFTVIETNRANMQLKGYCYFVLGEFRVLDADGNPIPYTATSNADHNQYNTKDGAGLPALNDGLLNNYFHSCWSGSTPQDYHYIELTFDEPISTFSLEWYGRPSYNHSSECAPTLCGITPKGYSFTREMLYSEYSVSAGETIDNTESITEEKLYSFNVESPYTFETFDGETIYGFGDVYPEITNNSNTTSGYNDLRATSIIQLIPTGNKDEFYIYHPAQALFYANSENYYYGTFGEQHGTWDIINAQAVTLTKRNDGEFELTYTLSTGEKVWIGYDMRGFMNIFSEQEKLYIEAGDYANCSLRYHVDCGFRISEAILNEGKLNTITHESFNAASIENEKEKLRQLVNTAQVQFGNYYQELVAGGYLTQNEDGILLGTIEEANAEIDSQESTTETLNGLFNRLTTATISFLITKLTEINDNNLAYYNNEDIFCNTENLQTGKILEKNKAILQNGQEQYGYYISAYESGNITSINEVTVAINRLQSYITDFLNHRLDGITFPANFNSSHGLPGTSSIYDNNYTWKSQVYILGDTPVNGLRITFMDEINGNSHNGFPMVALGELHFYDIDNNEIPYDENNITYNSLEGSEGSIANLYDNDPSTYYHSVWSSAIVDNDNYVYLDVTFPTPQQAVSISITTRNRRIASSNIIVTPTGFDYLMNEGNGGEEGGDDNEGEEGDGNEGGNTGNEGGNDGEEDEEPEVDIAVETIDVFTTPCLFISLADGGVDAYPLEGMKGEQYIENDTLYIPLVSGNIMKYHTSEYTAIGNDVPELPYLTSYKFNNKYNPNLNVDVIADSIIGEVIDMKLNSIGKRLTASFQLSDDRAVAYIGNKLQVSKKTRNRFAQPVKYSVTYPGYNVIQNIKVQDEIWDTGEDVITEVTLNEDMLYTNKPSINGDELGHMLDGDPSTVFHTAYGSSYDASVMPYITITLDEAIEHMRFYYQARTTGNYNPEQLNLYISEDGNHWQLHRTFTSNDDNLPMETGAEYTSPTLDLGGSYRYFKLEQTASEYHNNHMVFAEFKMYKIVPGTDEKNKLQDAVYKDVRVPFGRIYTINPQWLTDSGSVPRIDINMIYSASDISKETYLAAEFVITGNGVYENFVDSVQIKGRGNITWNYSKKPYRLKFSEKVKPFGLTKGKSWVLLANAQSGALMANAIAMKVGQLAEVPYTNHIIPVDLYINGEYKGNYMFTEHVGFSNNSVDEDEDLGYMLELDTYYDEDYRFRSNNFNLPVNIKEPDLADYDETTRITKFNAIKEDFNNFESAVYNNGDLGKYLDLEAAARFMLVNQLVMNMEICHPKSTFLWKGNLNLPGSKIVLGPLWDFDWGFGYQNTSSYFDDDYKRDLFTLSGYGNNFFQTLMRNREFQRYYYKVWSEFVKEGHIEEIKEYIQEYYDFAENSFKSNAQLWGDGNSYETRIAKMQNWLQNRQDYLFENITEYDITDLIHSLYGDVDCNDFVTIRDVALLSDYLKGSVSDDINLAKADVDKSGNIDSDDLENTAIALAGNEAETAEYSKDIPVSAAILAVKDTICASDETVVVPVYLHSNGVNGIKAMQVDITVPKHIWIEDITAGNSAQDDEVVFVQLNSELYRAVIYCKESTSLSEEQPVLDIALYNSTGSAASVTLTDIIIADNTNNEQRIETCGFTLSEPMSYNVTFMVDGEVYHTATVEYGAEIELPEEPTKTGHTFSGWSEVPQTMPAQDVTITATFTLNSYNVTFMVDGEVYHTATVEYGAEIELPEEPTKTGHTFSGWSEVPQTMPAQD
ncbi:MAG: CotH kinase family protein, partial [Bacteroidales bacterium]|nr:CotH kinase family protein [Bacteroidales bacterium]